MFEGFCKNPELRTLYHCAKTRNQRLIGKFRKILLLMFSLRHVSFAPKEMWHKKIKIIIVLDFALFGICTFFLFLLLCVTKRERKLPKKEKNQRNRIEFVRIYSLDFLRQALKNLRSKSYNSMTNYGSFSCIHLPLADTSHRLVNNTFALQI